MDEFKPEDELKPDPSDRRTGRSRQSSERSERTERGEPQINFDDIELEKDRTLVLNKIKQNIRCNTIIVIIHIFCHFFYCFI